MAKGRMYGFGVRVGAGRWICKVALLTVDVSRANWMARLEVGRTNGS